jgi:hypothetical protein
VSPTCPGLPPRILSCSRRPPGLQAGGVPGRLHYQEVCSTPRCSVVQTPPSCWSDPALRWEHTRARAGQADFLTLSSRTGGGVYRLHRPKADAKTVGGVQARPWTPAGPAGADAPAHLAVTVFIPATSHQQHRLRPRGPEHPLIDCTAPSSRTTCGHFGVPGVQLRLPISRSPSRAPQLVGRQHVSFARLPERPGHDPSRPAVLGLARSITSAASG